MPRHLPFALAIVIAGTLAGCGDDGVESGAEQFCREAAARRDLIISPPLGTEAELDATLEFYRLMGRLAPLAIAEQWNDLVVAMETAVTLVPGDPASEQEVAIRAYATERSAYEVSVWLKRTCNVDIPITTIAPQAPVPAITPTIAPAPTSVPAG